MASKELDFHLNIVGWLHIVGACILVVGGIFVFLFFAGIGVFSGELKAFGILGSIGLTSGVFMCLMALPGFAAGWGILKRKSWARTLGIVVGILDLAAVPVGTIIGGYTLWILFEKEVASYFEEPESGST